MKTTCVCFVSPTAYGYFNPNIDAVGGGDRQLSMVSKQLIDEFDVHFVVGDHEQPKCETLDGVILHASYSPDPGSSLVTDVANFWKLFSAMRRADADVYMYCGHPRKAAYIYLITKLLGKKWIYYLANDPNVKEQPKKLGTIARSLFDRNITDADRVVAQTQKQADLLRDEFDIEPVVIPSGYTTVDDALDHSEREFFLWVGRIREEQKRPDRFLDLAERFPGEEFVLIGPCGTNKDYCTEIELRADSLDNVRFRGRVDEGTLHDHYRRAIALVNTSDYEGFPSTYLEAWRYETPVVSYAVSVWRFIDSDDDPGCAEGDIDTLKKLVAKLSTDHSFRAALSEKPHKYFQENLTIDSVSEQYRSLIRSV